MIEKLTEEKFTSSKDMMLLLLCVKLLELKLANETG
jgi:hypothetical protein